MVPALEFPSHRLQNVLQAIRLEMTYATSCLIIAPLRRVAFKGCVSAGHSISQVYTLCLKKVSTFKLSVNSAKILKIR